MPVHSSGTQKINRARTQAEPKRSIPLQRCNNHFEGCKAAKLGTDRGAIALAGLALCKVE